MVQGLDIQFTPPIFTRKITILLDVSIAILLIFLSPFIGGTIFLTATLCFSILGDMYICYQHRTDAVVPRDGTLESVAAAILHFVCVFWSVNAADYAGGGYYFVAAFCAAVALFQTWNAVFHLREWMEKQRAAEQPTRLNSTLTEQPRYL